MPNFPRGEWKKGQPEPDVTKLTARPVQSGSSWLIYIPFKDSVQQAKNKLAASLQKAGFYIDIEHLSAE